MDVTVAVCTWNRCKLLKQTLEEMCELKIPMNIEWELIVVNNNCSDATDDVIDSYRHRLPIRRLFEPEQGLSNARNCAVTSATGDLVLWTDDDVLVGPDWLSEYVYAAREWPDASFFGGTIDPWFAARPPCWILSNLDLLSGVYAIRDLGTEIKKITSPENIPFGANMGMRRYIFDSMRFNHSLGLCGTMRMCSEEIDLMTRLLSRGHYGIFVGSAQVRHYIPAERFKIRYVQDVFRGHGQATLRIDKALKKKIQQNLAQHVRRYYKKRLKSWILSPFKTRRWLKAFIQASILHGRIEECQNDVTKEAG